MRIKIVMVLSHHHITVPVQLQRHRNVLLHMNFLHSLIMNIIPCHDGHLLNAFHRTRRSIRQVKYLVYHPARLIVLVILKKLTLFSLHKQRHSGLVKYYWNMILCACWKRWLILNFSIVIFLWKINHVKMGMQSLQRIQFSVYLKSIKNMGKSQQDTTEQLVYLLVENYPKWWIHSLRSVGGTIVDNSTEIEYWIKG